MCGFNIDAISLSQIPNLISNLNHSEMFHRRKFKMYKASPNVSHPASQEYIKSSAFSFQVYVQGVQMFLYILKHLMCCSNNQIFRYKRA